MASTVDDKLLKSTKFPQEFKEKVDIKKINIDVIKTWATRRITELLGNDDDVVTELCFSHLQGSQFPDIKKLQIQLTGFLDKDAAVFCKELWTHCLSAQKDPQGIPHGLLEEKVEELIQEARAKEVRAEEVSKRRDHEHRRDAELDEIRRRERAERSEPGRGRGRGRGEFWGRRDDERSRFGAEPRSPPPHHRRGARSPRDAGHHHRRKASPSASPPRHHRYKRSPSRSRSPPRHSRRMDPRPRPRSHSPTRGPRRVRSRTPPRRRRSPMNIHDAPRGRAHHNGDRRLSASDESAASQEKYRGRSGSPRRDTSMRSPPPRRNSSSSSDANTPKDRYRARRRRRSSSSISHRRRASSSISRSSSR